jgi:predicted dehydrogenase
MRRPRIGFLGVGWIGRHRMQAMLATGSVEAIAIAEPNVEAAEEARRLAPEARLVATLDELLALRPDGIAIATPSALHAGQAVRALDAGVAVFCQKPLGRTGAEVEAVLDAAWRSDRLLGVDLSYRHLQGARRIRSLVRAGALGRVYSGALTFHNGYGPDKPWFYDPELAGGGCVIDLGVHLVDLALWMLDFPPVRGVSARLFAKGEPLQPGQVEDHAVATLDLEGGATFQIACSWNLPVGCDAVIAAEFYGTSGGAGLRNIGGSFYDFRAERFHGTGSELLAEPPDEWGGRAAAQWAMLLAEGQGAEGSPAGLVETAQVLDRIYGRGCPAAAPSRSAAVTRPTLPAAGMAV